MANAAGRLCSVVIIAAVAASLSGCKQPGPEQALRSYVQSLREALAANSSIPESTPSRLHWYPSARERSLATDDVRVGLVDYLPLRACALDDLVAARNTGLGKVMRESSRLVYEHRMLARLTRCRKGLADPEKAPSTLADRLDAIIEAKREQLPRFLWNATLGSRELSEFFSLAAEPLALEAAAMAPELPLAFADLIALSPELGSATFELPPSELEESYYLLQSRPFGGELLATANLLSFYLDDATSVLTEARTVAACERGPSVFREHYVMNLQPYLAQIHRDGRRLLGLIERLQGSINVDPPPEFARFYQSQLSLVSEQGVWRRFERALEGHTRAWTHLFAGCELAPSSLPR